MRYSLQGFSGKLLLAEIKKKRKLLTSVESYLMANRGSGNHQDFKAAAQNLATFTLAYHLGTEDQQRALSLLFGLLADYIEVQVPGIERLEIYAKTLLGVEDSKNIEEWVSTNKDALLKLKSSEEWLLAVWPLLVMLSDDKFFHAIEPSDLSFTLALGWLNGTSYQDLIALTNHKNGKKPWGKKWRRLLTEDVMDFCERRLGYECPLIVAAISLFLFGGREPDDEESAALTLFQKSLQYGPPDWLSISTYDHGFADRVIALTVRNSLIEDGYEQVFFKPSLQTHEELLTQILEKFPTYFESVLKSLI